MSDLSTSKASWGEPLKRTLRLLRLTSETDPIFETYPTQMVGLTQRLTPTPDTDP